jgi:exosortase/archaeosortase family protein
MAMVLLGGIAAALMGFEFQFRHLEAYAAAHLYSLVTPTIAASSAPIIWFGLGSPGAFGLVITPDCSSALLIAPLCLLGVVLLIPRKLAVDRVMKALAVAAVILVAGNLTRIGVIALAIRVAGIGTGYQVGHLVLGSLISIICIAVSLTLLTVIITARDGEALWAPVTRWYRKAAS